MFESRQPELSEQTIELIVERVLQRIIERAPTRPVSERERCPQLYRVLDFLDANPTCVTLTLRELGLLTGVSQSYVLRARRQWQAMQKKKKEP